MNVDEDKYVDFSLAQKDTLLPPQHFAGPLKLEMPTVARTPKRMRLERMPLSGTTSAIISAIRKIRVECLPEYFEQTCDRRPSKIAVISGSSRLTYQELDRQANCLAHFFISRGIRKGNPVGILLERSLDTYIALLGILKAGAAFVPLDPSFSSKQIAFITEDAGLHGLVTTSAFREKTSILSCPILELDRAHEILSIQEETRPQVYIDPASLCYIIYMTNTSDRPKGVAVTHANVVNFLQVATPNYYVTRNDRVYQGMSITLDSSFTEIWPAWIAGATLIAGPTGRQCSGHELTEFLIEHKITVFFCMPALLDTIDRDVPSLRSLFIVGGACPNHLVIRWSRSRRRILNTYGFPETTAMATYSELFPNRPPTIGSPLPTYHIYLLDNQLRPVKDGEIGEICIGGPGVITGYLNRPDLTQERFIPNPVLQDREQVPRLYRTGDFGRTTAAGEIEYLGPINGQVKVRVYRIEPDEIEKLALQEAKTSRVGMLKRLNFKHLYNQVMTDPLYRNSLFNMASTFIAGGLGFVFWIIIAHLYKPENVGIATTLISLMTLISSFTTLGLNSSLNRYLPKSVNKNELINSSFIIVTIVTILASAIFLGGLQIFSPQLLFLRSNFFYIISFTVFVVFCSWNVLVDPIFMAFRSASDIFIKNTIISVSKILIPFALIALAAYGIFASAASGLALGILISLMILFFKFKIRPTFSVNISLLKETSAYSFVNYIVDFMLAGPSLVLPVIILNTLSAKYAAYYYVASMIQSILQVIPLAASQALLTEGAYNELELKKHVKKALATILVMLTPAIALVVFAGNILLQFFGKSYATEALQFLQLYSISTIFEGLLLISNAILNVKHQRKSLILSNVLAAILTLWLSYAFISNRLVGIGWGWMLGQAIAGIVALFFIIRNLYF